MSMSNSDSRKRLAGQTTPPAQDVETLADVMRSAGMEVGSVNGQMFREHVARAVLAAGYLSPAEVARLVQEREQLSRSEGNCSCPRSSEEELRAARETAWDEGEESLWMRLESAWREECNPYRPVPGDRSEAGA